MDRDIVDQLFDRLPPLAALTGWERDRLKEEAARILDEYVVEPDGDWYGEDEIRGDDAAAHSAAGNDPGGPAPSPSVP